MKVINPATEEVIAEYAEQSWEEIDRAAEAAKSAQASWREQSVKNRAKLIGNVGAVLRKRAGELSKLMTAEVGKPISGSESEVEKCAVCCDYFAEHAEEFLQPRMKASDASRSYVRFDPLGVVLAIMPWNFPLWQTFRFAAPGLAAGNAGLLKHAPNVPGCALATVDVFREAGYPPGIFETVLIEDNALAERLVAHPAIAAVTLTGSERAGSRVAAIAGSKLKKTVLELGGSDAFIVLADADVLSVARAAAAARCINNGQSCIAAKRFIVDRSIAAEFEAAMTREMAAMRVGDPTQQATQIGPLARLDLLENLDRQVRQSIEHGAKLLTGGKRLGDKRPGGKGFFYEPTVLANVKPGMAAFVEETFGPVAAIIRADDAEQAVRLANDSPYGLGASIWTRDAKAAESLVGKIDAGCVCINGPVKSDPRLPFGGIKNSGWGRELSDIGMHELMNIKTIWIA